MDPHIRSLLDKEATLAAALRSLDESAGDEPMTAEQQAEFDQLSKDLAAVTARRKQAEETARILKDAAVATATPMQQTSGLEVVGDNAEAQPWSPEGNPRLAFAHFMQAVRQADPRDAAVVDPRLRRHAGPSGTNEGVGSEGGFLVGTDETVELNRIMFASAQLASRCQHVEISAGSNSISTRMVNETSRVAGSRWGGVRTYWASEGDSVAASKPSFRLVDQKLKKLMGIWYCTEEELADVSYIASVGANAFGEEMAFELDEAIYRGDGVGKPLGMLTSPAIVTVPKETGQEANSLYYENIVKMYSRMPASSLLRAVWYANPDTMPQLMMMTMTVGTSGVPVYLPSNGAADAPFGTLLGRPIVPNEHSNSIGTVGDLVLGDLGWMRLITKGGVVAASSIHVRFVYDEQTFRFTYRVNAQPMLNSAITPAQGDNTVSPFVALATRS